MRYYYDGAAGDDDELDAAAGYAGAPDAETLDEDDGDADGDTDDADDEELEAAFPRGDGTADTAAVAYCPYCGELNDLAVDPGGGSVQSYVEDCQVCCQPCRVTVVFDRDGQAAVRLEGADE